MNEILQKRSTVLGMQVSPCGKFVITARGDGGLLVWDSAIRKKLFGWQAHSQYVCSVAFNSEGSLIVSSGADKKVKIWRFSDQVCLENFSFNALSVAFCPLAKDFSKIIYSSQGGAISTWKFSWSENVENSLESDKVVVADVVSKEKKELSQPVETPEIKVEDDPFLTSSEKEGVADSVNIFRKQKEEKKQKERIKVFNATADLIFGASEKESPKVTKKKDKKTLSKQEKKEKKVEAVVAGVEFTVQPVDQQTNLFDFLEN